MAKYEYNVVVIGAGSAGLVTSYIAAAAKAKVALIERHKMGGDCLNTGCVPSKAIIRSASFMRDVKRAQKLDLSAPRRILTSPTSWRVCIELSAQLSRTIRLNALPDWAWNASKATLP